MQAAKRRATTVLVLGFLVACTSNNGTTTVSEASSANHDAGTSGDATDAATSDGTAGACSVAEDCIDFPVGPAVSCCIERRCIYGQATATIACSDPDAEGIAASDYDRSCKVDSDCVLVSEGNFCYPAAGSCPNAAISKSAYPKYQADVAKTQAAACLALSSCGNEPGPCCQNGVCQVAFQCRPGAGAGADAAEASDAGGDAEDAGLDQ